MGQWLKGALCEPDGAPSSRRLLFFVVVVYSLGLVSGSLYAQQMISPEAQSITETLIWATAAALGFGKFAEKI